MVSDVVLPHINGGKLAEIARALRPGLKLLFVTGYAGRVLGSTRIARQRSSSRAYRPSQSWRGCSSFGNGVGQSFSRQLVARGLVPVCSILREGYGNSAIAVFNQNLAVMQQTQTLRHAVRPGVSEGYRHAVHSRVPEGYPQSPAAIPGRLSGGRSFGVMFETVHSVTQEFPRSCVRARAPWLLPRGGRSLVPVRRAHVSNQRKCPTAFSGRPRIEAASLGQSTSVSMA